jgi:hypothetical protein
MVKTMSHNLVNMVILMAEFLVFNCFLFLFLYTHILDLVYTKQICSLNKIIYGLAKT